MICKKCGEELKGEYTFCPKCGKRLDEKISKRKITGIIFLSVLFVAGIALYATEFYKNRASQSETKDNEIMLSSVSPDIDSEKPEDSVTAGIPKQKEPDEIDQYLSNLLLEPVEMTMGGSYQVELEKKIPDAIWTSSDEKIIQVEDGQLKATAPGNVTVTLSRGDQEVAFDVTVNTFPDMTLAVDCSKTIEMNDTFSDIQWESSSPEIVSVSEGVISSLGVGASTVTAYINDVPYSFEVVATTPDISTTSVRKIIGNTQQISILGTNGKIEWKSDNTAIATVSDTGLITAEGTGAGQSTVVHAYVDGMEFKVDVAVEPIPQLSSTYKIYAHQDDEIYKNARATFCTNANETVKLSEYGYFDTPETVLNVADADYSDGRTYPLYYTFISRDDENYVEIYLLGTSQTADVAIRCRPADSFRQSEDIIIYEPCENYGIIRIYHNEQEGQIATISVDGYEYEFVIDRLTWQGVGAFGARLEFYYDQLDKCPPNYMIEECSVDEIVIPEKINVDHAKLAANSRAYNPGTEWIERIGTKFVEEVEDQAIEMAVAALFKIIL